MTHHERFYQSPQPIALPEDMPLVFLEGPVQGAQDWQTDFGHRLLEAVPDIAVASPRALPHHQAGFYSPNPEIRHETKKRQVAYEFLARRLAFQFGSIALWYAARDSELHYPEGRPYAKTTEKEDSEVWGVLFENPDYPLILGIDPRYEATAQNSLSYIQANHELLGIHEHRSLDDVFNATVTALEVTKAVGPREVHPLTALSIRRAWDQLDSE